MNIGVDIDGTLECFPEFYEKMMKDWRTGKRILLTARPETERNITLQHLADWGIERGVHYDELVMYPVPYLFYVEVRMGGNYPVFLKDTSGVLQYNNMEHRNRTMEAVTIRANGEPERFNPEEIQHHMADWKAQVCIDQDIKVTWDDSNFNVNTLREAGVYVCHVDKAYRR